jgi:hypothetical protein
MTVLSMVCRVSGAVFEMKLSGDGRVSVVVNKKSSTGRS